MQSLHLQPLLAACRLFYRLHSDELARIAAFSRVRWFEAGEPMAVQGEPADTIYIVLSGSARSTFPGWGGHGEQVSIGHVAGWCALVEPFEYDSTVTAGDACITIAIDAEALRQFMDERAHVCVAVMRGIAALMLETHGNMSSAADELAPSPAACPA